MLVGVPAIVTGLHTGYVVGEATTIAGAFRLDSGAQTTVILDARDRPVFTLFAEKRVDVPLERISPYLLSAILTAEDRRFYRHAGIDPLRIGGAALANMRSRRVAQGGSTITQQLVRLTRGDRARTLHRKLREAMTALAIERRFTKHAILETYVNKVYLGEGFHGVEAAAQGYFGKGAADVTPAEAATLAALIKSPSTSALRTNADRVRRRRDWILQSMYQHQRLDRAAYTQAIAAPLEVQAERTTACNSSTSTPPASTSSTSTTTPGCEPGVGLYFKEAVRRQLLARLTTGQVYAGGLRVYTTIDMPMQEAAERAVAARVRQLERQRPGARIRGGTRAVAASATSAGSTGSVGATAAVPSQPPLQASLIAIDPTNGYVRALVGGRDFHESPFDRAVDAKRQPGSAFKPLVFAGAIESGLVPGSLLRDLDMPIDSIEGPWLPADGQERVQMTLRQALVASSNRAAVHLLRQVGVSAIVSEAQRFGIHSPQPAVPSLALGTGEVTLLELTSAYGVLANRGQRAEPTFIRRIETAEGDVLYRAPQTARRVVSEDTAFLVTDMLADVIRRGTGSEVRKQGFTRPAAGKTGTTNAFEDAWFVGFTPRLVTGVWVGYDEPREIRRGAFGGVIAVPIWAAFMKEATRGQPTDAFKTPAGMKRVAYCPLSGAHAGKGCFLAQQEADETHQPWQDPWSVATTGTTGTTGATETGAPTTARSTIAGGPPTTTGTTTRGTAHTTTEDRIYYDYVPASRLPEPCPLHPDPGDEPVMPTASSPTASVR